MGWVVLILHGVGILMISNVAFAEPLRYSQQFTFGTSYWTGQSQYDEWLSFRASLPEAGVNSITVKGSRDLVGRTCSDPAIAQQIADAMRAGAAGGPRYTLTINCDGYIWNTGSCSVRPADANNLELNVGTRREMCSCGTTNYVVRPGIGNRNWGGIAGRTCGAPTQTLTVEVNAVQEVDIDIKPGSDPNSINLCSGGAVPVAILGSDMLDVSSINTETLRFAEASVKVVGKKDPNSLCSYEDINGDLIDDLVCHFVTTDIAGVDGESTYAVLNGDLTDGTLIEGSDSINIVKDTCN